MTRRLYVKTEGYLKHLNQYYVINLDITGFISETKGGRFCCQIRRKRAAAKEHSPLS